MVKTRSMRAAAPSHGTDDDALTATRPTADNPRSKGPRNIVRRSTDYLWIALIYVGLYYLGEWISPGRSKPSELAQFHALINPLHLHRRRDVHLVYWGIGWFTMSSMTYVMWLGMRWWYPKTPATHAWVQFKAIAVNMLLLPLVQSFWDYLIVDGYSKVTMGNLSPVALIRDCLLWMTVFELSWYMQHRAMHDNKYLWKYGHNYHHGWKRPEHMIGITNFAFDHVVEVWVTMSSSFAPVLLFPINAYVAKALSLGYMILAILVHWDYFPWKYHLNHHYRVVVNYGSHWPFFDMLFGTYYPQGPPKGATWAKADVH